MVLAGSASASTWKRVQLHSLSLEVPRTWMSLRTKGFLFRSEDPNSNSAVATGVNITTSPEKGISVGQYQRLMAVQAHQRNPCVDHIRIQTRALSLPGGRALLILLRCRLRYEGTLFSIVAREYAFLNRGHGYVISFQSFASLEPRARPLFLHAADSVRFPTT
jgi:hypothetical protein